MDLAHTWAQKREDLEVGSSLKEALFLRWGLHPCETWEVVVVGKRLVLCEPDNLVFPLVQTLKEYVLEALKHEQYQQSQEMGVWVVWLCCSLVYHCQIRPLGMMQKKTLDC